MGNTIALDSITDKLLTKRFALWHVLVGVCYSCCTFENSFSQAIPYHIQSKSEVFQILNFNQNFFISYRFIILTPFYKPCIPHCKNVRMFHIPLTLQ